MGKMSRQKGARFEVEVAKLFTEWTGQNVRRTPRSGAYGGEGMTSLSGDLLFDQDFPYVLELKNRESWKLEHVFQGKGEVWEWWRKLLGECESTTKRPMLILKKNHVEPLVLFKSNDPFLKQMLSIGGCDYMYMGGITAMWLHVVMMYEPPGGRRIDHATEGSLPWGG